jgi:hypothetical protein
MVLELRCAQWKIAARTVRERRLLPSDAAILRLHSMALEYLLATPAQPRAVLLQTLLNRAVVTQLLPAKSLCVSGARLLLLRGAHMALS